MNPIATACQSGGHGNGVPRSSLFRSITRQRIVRSGNVRVASATATNSRTGSTALRPARTSLQCVPRTAHARKAPVTARPTTQAQREARLGDGAGGEGWSLECEGHGAPDFFDERPQLLAGGVLGLRAKLPGALVRPRA